MAKTARQILKENEHGKSARKNFESYWQTLHDYYDVSAQDVNTEYYPGTELTVTQLYDSFSLETADILASGLMNYLTPPASNWFSYRTKDPLKMESKNVLTYLSDVSAEVRHALNNSNFYNVMPEFFKNSGVYGTSILFEEEDTQDLIRFSTLPMKSTVIVEDARGRVIEYYVEFEYTATQAVTRFGDKVHPDVMKQHKESRQPDRKFMYILYIGPNWERNPQALDNQNKEWIVQWIDKQHQTEVERSGYDEMPMMTHRFYKRSNVVWGFSPAMKALPAVRMLNAKAKVQLRAEMKATDPPIALPDNAFLMPFNSNPRGTNYYKKGAFTQDDIFPIGNYGNLAAGMEGMAWSKDQIRSQMFTDVFLAFDGVTKQMNNPEVYERINEKMTLLGPAVGQFLSAVLDPVLHRTIGLLARQGRLPEPPQELLDDPNYEIEYLSTLAKAQRNGELQSMQNALSMVGAMAQFSPDVIDKIDPDKGVDAVWGITGAPIQMLRDEDQVQEIRELRAEAQQQDQQAAMLGQGAEVAVKATQASKNAKEAQNI